MFLGVTKTPDLPDGSPGPELIFLENDSKAITLSLASGNPTDYFLINIVGNAVVLKPVTLKPGPRADGKATEIAEIQADGKIVGNAEVPKP